MSLNTLVETVHEETGGARKQLMKDTFAVAFAKALFFGDEEAASHFKERFDNV